MARVPESWLIAILATGAGALAVWLQMRPAYSGVDLELRPSAAPQLRALVEPLPPLVPPDATAVLRVPVGNALADSPTNIGLASVADADAEFYRKALLYAEMGADLIPRDKLVDAAVQSKVALHVPAQVHLNRQMAEHLHDALARVAGDALRSVESSSARSLPNQASTAQEPPPVAKVAQQLFLALAPDLPDLLRSGRAGLTLRLSSLPGKSTSILQGLTINVEPTALVLRIERAPWDIEMRIERDVVPFALLESFDQVMGMFR